LALPTEAHHSGNINRLPLSLGKATPIESRGVSGAGPKQSGGPPKENAPQRWQARTGRNTHQVSTHMFALANESRKLA
jgi:hypothetical protein